jgi:ribose transport system permease protein
VKTLLQRSWFGPFLALLLLYACFSALAPDTFPSGVNLLTMLRQTAVVAVVAIGMTLVIIQGGIDLSVGSSVALSTVVVARALQMGAPAGLAVACGIAVPALAGLCNGGLIGRLRIPAFIVSLGSMSVLRGVAKGLAGEQKIDTDPQGLDAWMSSVAHGPIPLGVWLAIACACAAAVLLRHMRFGRYVLAIGSNEQAARVCGVPIVRVRLLVYTLMGVLAGVAGVLEFATLTVGDPTDSVGLELEVIAAGVVGGASLSGGQGSILGTLIGALLMTVIRTGCTHVGLPNWVQEIVTGAIIVVAVALDRWRHR